MGIDIRNGLQMECIACGLCVDACNNIMDQVERPRGLIRYDTTNHMAAAVKGGAEKFKFFRIRTFYYSAILALVGSVMLYALITRAPAELHILHDRNPLYVQLSSGEIRNGYTVKILNKTHDHKTYMISVEGLDGAVIDVSAAGDVGADNLFVPADSVGSYHINLHAHVPPDEPRDIKFILEDREKTIRTDYDAKFITKRK